MQTLTLKLEAAMVLLATFVIAITVMGSLNGLHALEPVVALLQGVVSFVLYQRWATPE